MASPEIPGKAGEQLCCPDSLGQSTVLGGAGCEGVCWFPPLVLPCLTQGLREGLQAGSPAPSLMLLHKAVLLYGRDPTDFLVGRNPLIGHRGRHRC